jgi:hypothetical protein
MESSIGDGSMTGYRSCYDHLCFPCLGVLHLKTVYVSSLFFFPEKFIRPSFIVLLDLISPFVPVPLSCISVFAYVSLSAMSMRNFACCNLFNDAVCSYGKLERLDDNKMNELGRM